jgi:hypothetical protein
MTTDPEKISDAYASMLAARCDRAEQKFKAGDKSQLLLAMKDCLELRGPIPQWAQDAFLEAYYILPKSWDDVFGPPIPKGTNLEAARRKSKIGLQLYLEVKRLNAEGTPIDDGLFETVGKQFSVSGGTAKRMYYDSSLQIQTADGSIPIEITWSKSLADKSIPKEYPDEDYTSVEIVVPRKGGRPKARIVAVHDASWAHRFRKYLSGSQVFIKQRLLKTLEKIENAKTAISQRSTKD